MGGGFLSFSALALDLTLDVKSPRRPGIESRSFETQRLQSTAMKMGLSAWRASRGRGGAHRKGRADVCDGAPKW